MSSFSPPVVLCFSGNDPSGGAGIQADIEALASMATRAAPVITALTVQDTENVKFFSATDPKLLTEQARIILEDLPVCAFKLGMLGSLDNIEAIHKIIHDYRDIPVIIDPIIGAGGGTVLSSEEMALAYSDLLFPLTTLVTPNSNEARILAPEADTLEACAQELMDDGCRFVLITGTHESSTEVINSLYGQHEKLFSLSWPRLERSYHGSGCTLAASIAGLIARGVAVPEAASAAQQYTWDSLHSGFQLGMYQQHPNRFFWTSNWFDHYLDKQ